MTLYFLVLGLEARRELAMGQLRERRRAAVPLAPALGGMAVPIAIYLAFNAGGAAADGWGTAMSTDTAFALGVLALAAPGSTRLRVRLLTLTVFDDLLALVVIAVAYTGRVAVIPLVVGVGLLALLAALRYVPSSWQPFASVILGAALWVALYEAHIDPVVSGLAIGLVTSAYPPRRTELGRVVERIRSFREQPTPLLARTAQRSVASAISPDERLRHGPLDELRDRAALRARERRHPHRRRRAQPRCLGPRALSQPAIAGVGVVAGVGFTVALLIASLAFTGRDLEEAKLGILATGLFASLGGWAAFRLIGRVPTPIRARQVAATVRGHHRPNRRRRPRARPRPRRRRRPGHTGRIRRLRVFVLRPGRGRRPRTAAGVRRRPALRLAPSAAHRRAPSR
jgi:Na+/H+ antiporter NhaA